MTSTRYRIEENDVKSRAENDHVTQRTRMRTRTKTRTRLVEKDQRARERGIENGHKKMRKPAVQYSLAETYEYMLLRRPCIVVRE